MRRLYSILADVPAARFLVLALTYAAAMTFTLWMSYQLRFDFHVPANLQAGLAFTMAWIVALKLAVLISFGQFQDSLSYFGIPDQKRILGVCVVSSLIIFITSHYGGFEVAPPRGVAMVDCVFSLVVLCSGRIGLQFLREHYLAPRTRQGRRAQRVAIIGAGDTGAALVRELLTKDWVGLRPVAFFDDFRSTRSRVHGIPVWGPPERLLDSKIAVRLDEVIIALPSARGGRLRSIVKILQQAKMPFRTIPSLSQLAIGTVSVTNLRPVVIEDLLGRDVVQVEADNVRRMLEGRTVLVTGAGGSIGSELCRQIASFGPRVLLMVERCEASLFPIEQELVERGFRDVIVPLVADVTDLSRMEGIFLRYRPHAVFHAAAHKHVPMMESQPAEAIRNNVLGTAGMAKLSYVFQVERFLLISTDKAINPTNVMGATKRMAEIFVQSMQTRDCSPAKFMAVRFGNVLGSSGSVVPVFARQIAAGGPVKVTHPDITRYFMIIPEAVSLVLQSAARAEGGEIFVLDMGKPVKILDLARQMIELSGLTPGTDIEIEFTGLRPGEKLYEELSHHGENVTPTDHPKILRFVSTPMAYDQIKAVLKDLEAALLEAEPHELKLLLHKTIPEYTPEIKDKGLEPATESGIRG
ncbi:MAG: polysaccharide biosynthesis protein, partial [Verrucomicrobiota bacterium]|nr:polysaccharide biosynthesis protein [Verrucomicrobiota bacterium]